jgi:hypothetical protein
MKKLQHHLAAATYLDEGERKLSHLTALSYAMALNSLTSMKWPTRAIHPPLKKPVRERELGQFE